MAMSLLYLSRLLSRMENVDTGASSSGTTLARRFDLLEEALVLGKQVFSSLGGEGEVAACNRFICHLSHGCRVSGRHSKAVEVLEEAINKGKESSDGQVLSVWLCLFATGQQRNSP